MSKKLFPLFVGLFFYLAFTFQAHSQEQKINIERTESGFHCTANGKPLFVYRSSPASYAELPEKEFLPTSL